MSCTTELSDGINIFRSDFGVCLVHSRRNCVAVVVAQTRLQIVFSALACLFQLDEIAGICLSIGSVGSGRGHAKRIALVFHYERICRNIVEDIPLARFERSGSAAQRDNLACKFTRLRLDRSSAEQRKK